MKILCAIDRIEPRNSKVALYYLTGKWRAQSSYNDENRKLKDKPEFSELLPELSS